MKCRECEHAKRGWFKSVPEAYVCIGTKEPFVISNYPDAECTEYPDLKNKKLPTEDLFVIGFDNASNGDHAVLSVTRIRGNKSEIVNVFYDKDAYEMYKHLRNW